MLMGSVTDRLREHRAEQNERRLLIGPAWHDLDLVCGRGDCRLLYPDSFSKAFKRFAAASGLPAGSRLHDVRHGVATVLLEQHVDTAIVSAMLGQWSVLMSAGLNSAVIGTGK
jgi:integrase